MVQWYGVCLSIAYIVHRHHSYIESLLTLWCTVLSLVPSLWAINCYLLRPRVYYSVITPAVILYNWMIFLSHISISISHEVLWKGWEEEQVLLANTHSVVLSKFTDQGEGSQQEKIYSHNFHGVILKQLMPTVNWMPRGSKYMNACFLCLYIFCLGVPNTRIHASLVFISSA